MAGAAFGQSQPGTPASTDAGPQVLKADFAITNAASVEPGIVAYSPDGRHVAVSSAGSIYVYEVPSGGQLTTHPARVLTGHTAQILGFAFLDTNTLVSVSLDQTAKIWDVATGRMRHSVEVRFGTPTRFALAPGHSPLAADTAFGKARLWNYETGEILKTFAPGDSGASALAFTPDGKSLVLGTEKGVLRLMDVVSWTATRTIDLDAPIRSVAASMERTVVGYSDGTVAMLSFGDQDSVPQAKKQSGAINSLAFSPNGGRFASASADHSVKIWDAASLKVLYSLQGHGAPVVAVAFRPDGQQIVSMDTEGVVRFWTTPKR